METPEPQQPAVAEDMESIALSDSVQPDVQSSPTKPEVEEEDIPKKLAIETSDPASEQPEPTTNGSTTKEEESTDGSVSNEPGPASPVESQVSETSISQSSNQIATEPTNATSVEEELTPKVSYKSTSSATVNSLKKLMETVSHKSFKLNPKQKEIVEDCKKDLARNVIPSVKLVELLKSGETNLALKESVIDGVSKIFTFENSNNEFNTIVYENYIRFSDLCIDAVCEIFKEDTDEAIELQIVKIVVNIILNDNVEVHTARLLAGIRLIYNIFILTVNESTKMIAEVTLTQIIDYYFQKIENSSVNNSASSFSNNVSMACVTSLVPNVAQDTDGAPVVLENLENLNKADEKKFSDLEDKAINEVSNEKDKNAILIKDCFLIFRAMSKLSTKQIDENNLDVRSTAIRSKLLSLKIIHSILKNHINCFLNKNITVSSSINNEKITFVDSIRNYLLLSLAKNAVYQLNDIYSVCLDIFYIMITNLRADFINEIPVLFSEIFFPIVEMPVSTDFQKNYFLSTVAKLANDPRLLIEFYLNFDCSSNQPNIIESIINFLIKTENNSLRIYSSQKKEYGEGSTDQEIGYDSTALNCIVSILRSLYSWSNKALVPTNDDTKTLNHHQRSSSIVSREPSSPTVSLSSVSNPISSNELDDPTEFESAKKRKTLLLTYCKLFNYKPKRGIQKLLEAGFIKSSDPKDVAQFLLENNNIIDKEVLGEYLGEGDEYNISVMHAFVDSFDFSGAKFVNAMRSFLQSFRLPGESQKIDRFMLKFAETYYKSHPNSVFAQADTLYVLSYSVIMLNTDQHNNQVKSRMSVEDFIKNNSGIDDGKDLPRQLLVDIYNDIATNEIILESEQHHALISGSKNSQPPTNTGGLPNLFSNKLDIEKEYYIQAAKEISSKTEKAIKINNANNNQKKSKFFSANHVEHVRSIFDNLWMSFLAALTPSFKEFDGKTVTKLCLEGIKLSIKIACIFNLADARTSFINALLQFTNLINIEEMRRKNLDAINVLLNICVSDGKYLESAWNDILIVISQLERLQLIAKGVDASNVPDVLNAKLEKNSDIRSSHESSRSYNTRFFTRKTTNPSELAQQHHANQKLHPDIATLIASTELTVKIDKIFASTEKLDINAITYFVEALTEVALDEVESSGSSNHPRMFSLQKLVDICYYNMGRIRVEWSKLWSIMGEAFNKIGCNDNLNIVIFALDSLRQLSMRFFEIEELAYFKFQKDFLKPFAFVLENNENIDSKTMVLECTDNMILSKGNKIKSGWVTIFDVLKKAASADDDQILNKSYEILGRINKSQFSTVYDQDGFEGLVESYSSLGCNEKNQKISLHAIADMRLLIKKVSEYETTINSDEQNEENSDVTKPIVKVNDHHKIKFFPVLKGLKKVVLENSDLESRSKSLDHLFDSLVEYGDEFTEDSWDEICQDLLFPIFGVLSNHWSQLNSHDDLSVWLSTTLIQALKNMVAIFTHFDSLIPMLDGYLKLLCSCILQENDTISKIGRNCLQSLILDNSKKFKNDDWDKVTKTLVDLFENTTAIELFLTDPLREEENNNNEDEHDESTDTVIIHSPESPNINNGQELSSPSKFAEDYKKRASAKGIIVVKSVLQLLMIETLSELFENETFFESIPLKNLLKLTDALFKSYNFSHDFNNDYNLRVRLWNSGVSERIPNLLKQESSSSGVYINIIFRLLINGNKTNNEEKEELLNKLIPLCVTIIENYISLDETKQRIVNNWRPVVIEIMQGYYELDDDDFIKNCPIMYDLILSCLDKQLPQELRSAIKNFLTRVGELYLN